MISRSPHHRSGERSSSELHGRSRSVLTADERWDVIGNPRIIEHLQRVVNLTHPSHAVLLVGPRGIGKTTIAESFARALLCLNIREGSACGDCAACALISQNRHPDLIRISGADNGISINEIRLIIHDLHRRPVVSRRHVAIIDHANGMSEEAANALLKTLEEPAGETVIVLTATSTSLLPATVVSRCSVYLLTIMGEQSLQDGLVRRGVDRKTARELAVFSDGRPAYALFLADQHAVYQQALIDSDVMVDLIKGSIHERVHLIQALAERIDDSAHQDNVIERWESLLRRLLRLSVGLVDHGPHAQRLRLIAERLTQHDVLNLFDALREVRERIRANVNPRLALESFALHLPRL